MRDDITDENQVAIEITSSNQSPQLTRGLSDRLAGSPRTLTRGISARLMGTVTALNSSIGDDSSEITFYCKICFENCSDDIQFVSANCPLGHKYCKDCMKGNLTVQINDGVITHPCPGRAECSSLLTREEIKSLVSNECFSKFEHFETIKTTPNFRECPGCNFGYTHEDSSASPLIVCGQCQTEYCFFHANAHVGVTCEEYTNRLSFKTRNELQSSEEMVKKSTRPCGGEWI